LEIFKIFGGNFLLYVGLHNTGAPLIISSDNNVIDMTLKKKKKKKKKKKNNVIKYVQLANPLTMTMPKENRITTGTSLETKLLHNRCKFLKPCS